MKDQSNFPVLIILMLRALAGSKTICDCPYGAWALPTGLFADGHGATCAQFFLSMWAWAFFLSICSEPFFPDDRLITLWT